MRVLLDEQLPRQLARHLIGHDVGTVQQQGWAGLTNGELLRRAADNAWEVFLTADQNIEFQQNLAGCPYGLLSWSRQATRSRICFPSSTSCSRPCLWLSRAQWYAFVPDANAASGAAGAALPHLRAGSGRG